MKKVAIGVMVSLAFLASPKPVTQATIVIVHEKPRAKSDNRKQTLQSYIELKNKMVDAKKIAGVIVDVADEYGHDYALIASIIAVESNFNPDAHNHRTNCIGLMQVRPVTEQGANVWLSELKQEQIASSVKDLKVDWRNTKAGCYILAKCKEVTPNTYRAVMRYNGGMDLNYLSSVMGNYLAIADKPMR